MPFIVPFVVGAVGLTGAAATIATIGGQIALGVGLSFAARKLRPKERSSDNGAAAPRGVSVGLRIDTAPPRQWVVGEVATGGSLVYWQLSGTNNDKLHMVIALADHECDSLRGVYVNGKFRSWNSTTGQVSGYGADFLVRFYSGAAGQTADASVVAASGGRWTNSDVGIGVCYAVVELNYSEDKFPDGIPEVAFLIRGARLFDPRASTTVWTRNSAIVLYNLLRGVTQSGEPLIGMNVPASAIRLSEAQAAANACAESVAKREGGTESRYLCDAVFDSTQSNREIIETILATMAGELICVGGIYRMFAGVAQTPVAALTDDDLITAEPLTTSAKRSRNELTNAVFGTFTDPDRGYTSVALPPRTSSADETADGARLSKTFDLVGVTSRSQGQRVLEIERRRARRMGSASFRARARWCGLEPGDWITWSSDRRGYVSRTFYVQSTARQPDLSIDLVLIETDAGIDDWTASIDELVDSQVIDLASGGPTLTAVTGVSLVNVTIEAASGVQRPGLQMQWTPITDPTVVELDIEFRKVGTTLTQKTSRVSDPSDGSYTWVSGVQSGAEYEARVRPITRPSRGVTWSAWVPAGTASGNQIVPLATTATAVPPNTITPEMLTAQARFEISLVTQTDAVLGSIAQQISDLRGEAERIAAATLNSLLDANDAKVSIRVEQRQRIDADLALAQQVTTIQSALTNDVSAAIQQEQLARTTADDALARDISTAVTRLDENTAQVTALAQSVNGLSANYTILIDINGRVVGYTQLSGTAEQSEFVVAADFFKVAGTSGAGVPVFALQTVNGVGRMALRGDMLADGTITARALDVSTLSAITANLGTVTAGLVRDASNIYNFNVTQGRLARTDGTFVIDLRNKVFEIEF